jgi:hypothetical protein
MSIRDLIRHHVAKGALRPARPLSPRAPVKREMYLTVRAQREFDDASSAVNILCGRGYIQRALERWVTGGHIYASNRSKRFLKRLDEPPPEIWEIRVTEPATQGRLFCRFAATDCLVLTGMHTRKMLGDAGSAAWTHAMADCETQWNTLFPGLPPHRAEGLGGYISGNFDDVPF